MKKLLGVISIVWLLPLCMLAQSNQIIVHDPVAIEAEGQYFIFNTGVGITCWSSVDLKNWNHLESVFSQSPKWAKETVPLFDGNIWAPDISFHNGIYYLYYSISSFASNRSAIGVATNTTLDQKNKNFQWVDHGPIIRSFPGRDNWNAIDPNLIFDEDNQPWLTFGSFWGGLKIVKLSNDLLTLAEPQVWNTVASRQRNSDLQETDPGNAAIEAPFIFKHDDQYYLFVSFDLCCRGARSTYNVRVGRSKSVTGPYVDRDGVSMLNGGGTLVIKGDQDYYGIGHNSVYSFDGIDYMFSHGYDQHDKGRPKLLTHHVKWDEQGWPSVEE